VEKITIPNILIDAEWNRNRGACYENSELDKLYDRPYKLSEVMTNQHGDWNTVPSYDRVWVLEHVLAQSRKYGSRDRTVREFRKQVLEEALPSIFGENGTNPRSENPEYHSTFKRWVELRSEVIETVLSRLIDSPPVVETIEAENSAPAESH
jgi:hypothetical protein